MRRLVRARAVKSLAFGLVLLAALVLSPVGVAAPASCNLLTYNCPGDGYSGPTSQVGGGSNTASGGLMQFVTDPGKHWIAGFEVAIAHENCSILPNHPLPVQIGSFGDHFEWHVVNGHFSGTVTYPVKPAGQAGAQFPANATWHITGTLIGNRASGTIHWAFVGAYNTTCTPSSGTFTWKATFKSRIGNA